MTGAAPSETPAVYVVVLNWNGSADTARCVLSVEAERTETTRLIVVDNNSRADDVAAVAAGLAGRESWTELVRNDENLGFAGGCNVGIRLALDERADYVLLLNNDATLEPGALAALLDHMRSNSRTGLAAPLILDANGERVWAAGGVRARREVVCKLGLGGAPAADAPREPFEAWALTGCALLARREVFEQVGLFDERYFAYVEDVDFSRRAADDWRLDVVPAARLRHRVSASSGGGYTPLRSYLMGRATALFVRTRAGLDQRIGFAVAAPLGLLAALAREAPRGNARAVWAKARGYLDGLRGRAVDRSFFG